MMRKQIKTIRPIPSAHRRFAAAATEFAVTLPLLLLLGLGSIEMGRAVAVYSLLSNAVRVGAEYGATHGYTSYNYASWQNQVSQQVQAAVQGNAPINASGLTVTVSGTSEPYGLNLVNVSASYQYTTITQWPFLPNQFTLTHDVAMRRFR
jgi:Flp pilus assembly protein TadG